MQALEGIRVIDASRILAGPHCGQMLADNGAEVIKVEPLEGEKNRSWPPIINGDSMNFLSVNRGKLAITLNLKVLKGRELLHRLIKTSDVFIQNFLPDTAAKLGVDYDTLIAINPDLIYLAVSGYGSKGPLRNRAGYDAMVTAYCGIMALTGEPDGPPVRLGISALDMASGMLGYAGVVTALLARASGKARGQKIDVSLMETGISLLGPHALNWLVGGRVPRRKGNNHPGITPYAPYRCLDGEIMIGAPNEGAWQNLCVALGAPELTDDPRFTVNSLRTTNSGALREALERILTTSPVAYWVERLADAGIACAPINALDQVLDDEQVLANEAVVEVQKREGGSMRLVGLPFKLSETPGQPGWAPPDKGEDTDDVLQRLLDLDTNDLATLRDQGVI